jgi:hypothetical protein
MDIIYVPFLSDNCRYARYVGSFVLWNFVLEWTPCLVDIILAWEPTENIYSMFKMKSDARFQVQ